MRALLEMRAYAQQCASNLELWEARFAELSAKSEVDHVAPAVALIRRPEDFATAFPLTLPSRCLTPHDDQAPVTWHRVYTSSDGSSSCSDGSSESGNTMERPCIAAPYSPLSVPASPAESLPPYPFSPRCDFPPRRPPSSAGSTSSSSNVATTAIRAAYDARVRKKKSFYRTSWNSSVIAHPNVHCADGPAAVALVVSTASHGDGAVILPGAPPDAILVGRPTPLDTRCSPA